MYAENVPAVLRNQTVINNLTSKICFIETYVKIPDDCRYPLSRIQAG